MEKMRVIKSCAYNPYMNMAIDEAMMIAYKEGKIPPTLRFYTWQRPTISVGYFQKLEDEIDLQKCSENNFGYVRRITGGRAVLHDEELTYSIVLSENEPLLSGGITASYKFISEGLVRGLNLTGIKTDDLSRGERIGRDNLTSACFNAHSFYEISINKKKIVGSAQTRKNGVLMQHGSIILNFDAKKLFDVIKLKDESKRERLIDFTNKKASGIENEMKKQVDIYELEENLIKGVSEKLNVKFSISHLTNYEISLANEICKKYEKDSWNKKR